MAVKYPDWATEKQLEGMREFGAIAYEYGNFDVEFEQENSGCEGNFHRFYAIVTWGWEGSEKGQRKHVFDIAFGYEKTWTAHGEEMEPYWQFLFSGGDSTREISTETFFLSLFFYLDDIAVTKAA